MNEWLLKDICGSDLLGSIVDTLKINLFDPNGEFHLALEAVRDLHNGAIKPFATMLLFIFFICALFDKMSSENFTWEQMWRTMAMLLVSKYLIEHGFEILEYLFGVGIELLNQIQYAAPKEVNQDFAQIIKDFKEGLHLTGILSILGDILLFVILLIPWVMSWIMRLCVNIICYSRIIEIYARATFAPVALSDFFHSGLQGTGWRFLKNFLAVSIQGAMILVIGVIFSKLFAGIIENMDWADLFGPGLGVFLAYYAAAVMVMFKSLSLSKELLGTN